MTTPAKKTIRVLLVDDHQVVRVGLRSLLTSSPTIEVIGEAWSVETAVSEARRLKPDVALVDIRLPDGSGVVASRELRRSVPHTRILFLTSYEDEEAMIETMTAEAHGYLLKEVDETRLIRAIEAVAGGQSILDAPLLQRLRTRRAERLTSQETPPHDDLSMQEERVLSLVAQGKTNKEIGRALRLHEKTIRNYLTTIYTKLRVNSRSQALAYYFSHLRRDICP
jgi:DNA-binding NarL/FixJ family response regulator